MNDLQKSIKQRLGATPSVNTSNRFRGALTQNQRRTTTNRVAGRGSQRGNRTQSVSPVKVGRGGRGGPKQIVSQTITRGGPGTKRSTRGRVISPTKKAAPVATTTNRTPTKSPRARGAIRGARRGGRAPVASPPVENQVQRGRGRGRGRGGRGGRGQQRGGAIQTTPRGQSSGRGRGRGGRGGATPVSKEDLDKQLDQYMSKTRGALDQDLENYMSLSADVEMS